MIGFGSVPVQSCFGSVQFQYWFIFTIPHFLTVSIMCRLRIQIEPPIFLSKYSITRTGHQKRPSLIQSLHPNFHITNIQFLIILSINLRSPRSIPVSIQRSFIFIVPSPYYNTGMMWEPPNILLNLYFGWLQKIIRRGVHGTGEHEVLPDHDSQFVGNFVEPLGLVHPASPNS